MITATLWVTIHEGSPWPNSSRKLWVKDVTYLPMPGDEVVLYGTEEEPRTGGPTWAQKRRYWSADGTLNVELESIVVDPTPEALDEIRRPGTYHERPWWTQTDGHPDEYLPGLGGWTPYEGGRG